MHTNVYAVYACGHSSVTCQVAMVTAEKST